VRLPARRFRPHRREDAVVAALAFVKAEARIPARALVAGIPARVEAEPDRKRIDVPGAIPLSELKKRHA